MEHIKRNLSHVKSHLEFHRSRLDKVADFMTEQFGTLWFLIFNAAFFLGWIEWNLGWFGFPIFDPFPFNFLTMTVSLEAIFLAIIVLISQNRQSKIADIRQQIDFEVDVRAEAEINKILHKLDDIHRHLSLGNPNITEELEKAFEVDLAQIQSEIERNSDF
jgi:uncharacterized membrane protein